MAWRPVLHTAFSSFSRSISQSRGQARHTPRDATAASARRRSSPLSSPKYAGSNFSISRMAVTPRRACSALCRQHFLEPMRNQGSAADTHPLRQGVPPPQQAFLHPDRNALHASALPGASRLPFGTLPPFEGRPLRLSERVRNELPIKFRRLAAQTLAAPSRLRISTATLFHPLLRLQNRPFSHRSRAEHGSGGLAFRTTASDFSGMTPCLGMWSRFRESHRNSVATVLFSYITNLSPRQ